MTASDRRPGGNSAPSETQGSPSILRFFGLKRSGNHAIIYWFIRNSDRPEFVFFNNCTNGERPEASFDSFELGRSSVGGEIIHRNALEEDDPRVPEISECTDRLVVLSYEDLIPLSAAELNHVTSGFASDKVQHNFLVYRSFLNWLASFATMQRKVLGSGMIHPQREAVLLTCISYYCSVLYHLHSHPKDLDLVPIHFDAWSESEAYREKILASVGYEMKISTLDEIPTYGGGSTFSGRSKPASELDVSNRWKRLAEDPANLDILRICMRSDLLVRLLDAIFPEDLARAKDLLKNST